MKNKHLYIFNSASRAQEYGIGTYIDMLFHCLENRNFKVTYIEIYCQIQELKVTEEKNMRHIRIPQANNVPLNIDDYSLYKINEEYFSSIPLVLIPYINKDEINVYHINYLSHANIAKGLKKYFGGHVVTVVHYTEWSFRLYGNKEKFEQILNKNENELTRYEDFITCLYNREKDLLQTYSDHIIAISKHSIADLVNYYEVDQSKISLIPNALVDKHEPMSSMHKKILRKRYQIRDEETIVLFAGRIDKIKGVDMLIDACRYLEKTHHNLRVFIAGNGELNEMQRAAVPYLGNILFTGYLPKKELYKLYVAADVGVVPSRHEEFGYVALEMMMHGLPIIVTDTTGLAETVVDNVTGSKVKLHKDANESKTVKQIADAICDLTTDQQKRLKFGRAGRKRFKLLYDYRLYQEKILDVYESGFTAERNRNK
ncbi:MAG: glycosyltransferase [Alistipes indistinctus]|nr:glycosyltransferase [Alistipes indistinctus]